MTKNESTAVELYEPEKFQGELKALEELKEHRESLLNDSEGLVIADNKTYEGVKKSRTVIQRFITHVDKKRKYLNRENKNLVDSIAAELLEDMEGRKEELVGKITVWDEKKLKEKQEKERLEKERQEKIQNAIFNFRTTTSELIMTPGKTSKELDEITEKLRTHIFDKKAFAGFMDNILLERSMLVKQCRSLADSARIREQEEYERVKQEYFELFKEAVEADRPIEQMKEAIKAERERIQKIADADVERIGKMQEEIDRLEKAKKEKDGFYKESEKKAENVTSTVAPEKKDTPAKDPHDKAKDVQAKYMEDAKKDRLTLMLFFSRIVVGKNGFIPDVLTQDAEKTIKRYFDLLEESGAEALAFFDAKVEKL